MASHRTSAGSPPLISSSSTGTFGDPTVTIEGRPVNHSPQGLSNLFYKGADSNRRVVAPGRSARTGCGIVDPRGHVPRVAADFPALSRAPATPRVAPCVVLTCKPMPVSTSEELIAVVRRSRLLGTMQFARVKDYAARHGKSLSPEKLAQWMVKQNLVTVWQAERLLAGVSSFFLGNYKFLHPIAEGAMGVVFKAQHAMMGRTVAIKVLSKTRLSHPNAVARFAREVQAVAALDHPNIVTAYDAGQIGQTHYLVMEYIDGIDLHCFVEQCGQIPLPWACDFIRQVALGLHHAHSQGMVHRDIKPANILVTWKATDDRPMAKILDLGLARIFNDPDSDDEAESTNSQDAPKFYEGDSQLTQAGMIVGTPDYLAPEQISRNREVDARSDIFGLGCTLFKLLTGQLPYSGPDLLGKLHLRVSASAPPAVRLRTLLPDAPQELDTLLARMLERDPDARPQTALEVAEALAPFARPPDEKWDLRPRSLSDEETGEIGSSQLIVDPHLKEFLSKLGTEQAPATVDVGGEATISNHRQPLLYRRKSNFPWLGAAAAAALVLTLLLLYVLRQDGHRANVWPGNPDGVTFVWAHRLGASSPSEPVSQFLMPQGEASYYDDQTLAFSGQGAAMVAPGAGQALRRDCRTTSALAFEAWITPHERLVSQPVPIVNLECDDGTPNLALLQREDVLVLRMRTTTAEDAPEIPLARLRPGIPQHVLLSYRPGDLRCYINGRQMLASRRVTGTFATWPNCQLVFGQVDGRGWQGWLQGIAIRSRFVDQDEAMTLYAMSQSWQTKQSRTARRTASH